LNRGAADLALLLLRIGTGLGLALAHGLPKVQQLLAGDTRFVQAVAKLGFPAPTLFAWLCALAELAGGAGLALGLLTRACAAVNVVNLAVAAVLRDAGATQVTAAASLDENALFEALGRALQPRAASL